MYILRLADGREFLPLDFAICLSVVAFFAGIAVGYIALRYGGSNRAVPKQETKGLPVR